MHDFFSWLQLLTEERAEVIPPGVLDGYETAFKQALQQLLQRSDDPAHRQQIEAMLECPVRDARGGCRRFSDYIVGALIKNGVQERFDIEAVLSYIVEKMLWDRSLASGSVRPTLFGGFDPERTPDVRAGLEARFKTFLSYALRNVLRGKIPRLATIEPRPQGTVSIGQGRQKERGMPGEISPDQIASRPSSEAGLGEMVEDITTLLRRKEQASGFPLVALFQAMMSGQNRDAQRAKFGDTATRRGRPLIVQTLRDYGESTGNYHLLSLLKRFDDFQPNKPTTPGRQAAKAVKPLLPEKERDYASIISVLDRLGRPVGTADLGKYRRRWLDYAPRNATSGYRNRLEEVLDKMVQDGVLRAAKTSKGAFLYSPGPNYETYRQNGVRTGA